MKITIELFHDELLPHQRGALAVLLNPVAPKPLRDTVSVRGEERDLSEFVPGGDDLGEAAGDDERVVGDRSVPAQIKRSEVVLRVGDKVRLRDGYLGEITSVGIISEWGPEFTVANGNVHLKPNGLHCLAGFGPCDVVEINGVPVVED